ncbi:hypothetical protein, partial [Salipiger aestuarii]|uniref:hypothetical protein n=1 Tax=Salipiger aestuarii TaxID=568098 RepID=UPI001CC2B7CC
LGRSDWISPKGLRDVAQNWSLVPRCSPIGGAGNFAGGADDARLCAGAEAADHQPVGYERYPMTFRIRSI